MKRNPAVDMAFLLVILFAPRTGQAGWVVSSQVKEPNGTVSREETYFERDRIRKEGQNHACVVDFSTRKVMWIDKERNVFGEMGIAEFRNMSREYMAMTRKGTDWMAAQGLDVRTLHDPGRARATITPAGGATIAGYSCDGYRVSVDGNVREEIWFARNFPVLEEVGPAAWKELLDILREEKRAEQVFKTHEEDPAYEAMMREGFPMRIVDRKEGSIYEVSEVRNMEIFPSFFSPPSGYRRATFEELLGERAVAVSVTREPPSIPPDEMRSPTEPRRTHASASSGPEDMQGAERGEGHPAERTEAPSEDGRPREEDGDPIGRAVDRIVDGAWEGIKGLFR